MKFYFLFLLSLLGILPNGFSQNNNKLAIKVTPLTTGIYVHTSYKLLNGQPFPSNGLLVETTEGVVLIDTGWGEKPTKEILDWVKNNLRKPVVLCVVSHAHEDRLGGIKALQKQNIRVISTRLTAESAARNKHPQPAGILPADTTISVGGTNIRTFYPGPGHTEDNITVWFPDQKVLYGGCFVKSTHAKDLGNVADANLRAWPNSLNTVISEFPDPNFVIPGHQDWSNKMALQHTLNLLRNVKSR
ncbi:subclass B1 metallo-beta-lactamase [Adhaeribacter sp. BT258]|uniref:beta-lactamase n=1 Tax=Adhaeribacter terrigena TaxID=2793070 RepID=A0ABS1BX23_9BACT|nr:subclass B1 metallo-beta-lactamase [Adhaeribacter terrigena]MBK0401619.1 subclass B1 metallo-beta-lactamase [Adhaeribacter terrigena]